MPGVLVTGQEGGSTPLLPLNSRLHPFAQEPPFSETSCIYYQKMNEKKEEEKMEN